MIKKPSEIISDFLELLGTAANEYGEAYQSVGKEDRKVTDFLHEFEFAENKAERNKVGTKLQQSRRTRRKAKDTVQLYERIVKFCGDGSHKGTIRDLKSLLGQQLKEEEYLFGERIYKERMDESESNSER